MTSFHILFLKFPSFYLKNMFYFLCIFLSSQAFLHQVSSQLSTSSFMIIQDKHCTSSFSLFLQSNVYNFFPKAKTQPLPPTHLHIQIQRSFDSINALVNKFSIISFNFSTYKTKNCILLILSLIPMHYFTTDLSLV